MACKQCEKCKLLNDDLETCPGQATFDPKQCPIEKEIGAMLKPKGKKKVS